MTGGSWNEVAFMVIGDDLFTLGLEGAIAETYVDDLLQQGKIA